MTSIGEAAFDCCTGLTNITVESGNSVYDSRDNCNAIIETVTNTLIAGFCNTVIPNSVTSIGNYAFSTLGNLLSITIPNSVISIGDYAFAQSALTSITIPNSVTSIGNGAFHNCAVLTSITIPNSVTSIGGDAFYGSKGLTSITIPNSVTSIGGDAFGGCNGLTEVHSMIEQPFAIDDKVFQYWDDNGNMVFTSATLYVPKGTKEKYQATNGWKQFTNIIEMDDEEPEPQVVAGDITGTGVVEDEDVDAFIELYLDDEIPEPGSPDFSRFDANGDGIITLADAVAIFYLSNGLNFDGTDPNAVRAMLIDNGKWIIDNNCEVTVEATELGNGIVRYTLTSDFEYAGFAIDVKGAQVVGESAEGMTLRSADTKGKHRIVAYNFGQAAAAGTVLTLDVLGEAQFSNITFSDANARNIRFRLDEATSISAALNNKVEMNNEKIYDLQGRAKEGVKKGVNILRHANGKTMKVSVK